MISPFAISHDGYLTGGTLSVAVNGYLAPDVAMSEPFAINKHATEWKSFREKLDDQNRIENELIVLINAFMLCR